MFALAETRFSFVGDEYIYAEISREMDVASAFKALAVARTLQENTIPGILEICPANASYLIRYNPDVIAPWELMEYIKGIDLKNNKLQEMVLPTRILEIPTWYNDPITREYAQRFRERNLNECISDFDFVVENGHFGDRDAFIARHCSTPYLITMTGYILGTAWEFPLTADPASVIEVPKYVSPRTTTPKQAVGIGGGFTVVYPVESPGSYQLIGMTPVPVYHPEQQLAEFADTFFLAREGDVWVHRAIDEQEYDQIAREVAAGTYTYRSKQIELSFQQYAQEGKRYMDSIIKELYA